MFMGHIKEIVRNSFLFFITSLIFTVGAVALYGLIIGIGFFIIGLLSDSTAWAAAGAFAIFGAPVAFSLFIGFLFIFPSAIAGLAFGISVFGSRSLNLPKVTLLLLSMGAGYIGAHIGMPQSAKDHIPLLAMCTGLVVSATICYTNYFKKYFNYLRQDT